MAARKASGAERNSGNVRIRSYMSSGIPWMVDAVSGDGRTGREGFVSELNDRTIDRASGTGDALLAKVGPPAL